MRPATRAGSASLRRRATPRGNNFRTRCLRFSTPRSTTTTSTSTGAHARARGVVSCDVPMPGFKRSRARARERREVFPSGAARERDGSEIVLDASARRVPRLRRDRRLRAEPGRSRASASPSPTVSPRAGARATLESRPPKSRTDPSALSSLALLTQARRAPARHRQALAEGSSPVRGAFAGRYPDHVVPERGCPSSQLASSGNLRSGVFF